MGLAEITADVDSTKKTLTIRNRDEPEPIVGMLKRMVDARRTCGFGRTNPPREARKPRHPRRGRGGTEQLAISSIADVGNSVLMVNSDLYVTGTRSIDEVETPAVLAGLDETTFTVSGKQKMLLIEISRHVEALAYRSGGSTLHTGFQHLARIEDERGTKSVYERLVDAGVAVHVYGSPDGVPSLADELTVPRGRWRGDTYLVVRRQHRCPDEFRAPCSRRKSGRTSGPAYGPSTLQSSTAWLRIWTRPTGHNRQTGAKFVDTDWSGSCQSRCQCLTEV